MWTARKYGSISRNHAGHLGESFQGEFTFVEFGLACIFFFLFHIDNKFFRRMTESIIDYF